MKWEPAPGHEIDPTESARQETERAEKRQKVKNKKKQKYKSKTPE